MKVLVDADTKEILAAAFLGVSKRVVLIHPIIAEFLPVILDDLTLLPQPAS